LLIETLFLETEEIKSVEKYFETNMLNDNAIKETVNYLFRHYFIIETEEEAHSIYLKCKDLIQPPAISNVYIVVTENCNFNCHYCFISDAVRSNRRDKIMSKEVAIAAIELLQKTYAKQKVDNNKTITFYGGEPLLNFELIKFFIKEVEKRKTANIFPKNVIFGMITNGSLLSSEIIDFCKQHKVSIGISYDVDKDAHSNRKATNNNETYNIVREKIELCKHKELPFTLSTTITESVIRNKRSVLNEILKINPNNLGFNLLIPNKAQKQDNQYYEKATDFIIEAFKIFRKKGIYEDRIMRKVKAFSNKQMYLYDCCASGGNQYVISPTGEIGICHAYLNNRQYFSSSVFDMSFDFNTNENFKHWRNRTPLLMEKCVDCECLGICGGGCPYVAEYLNGSIYELDERFCIHAKRLLKWLVNDLYENIS
jgi:uncharacterized protein